MARYASAALGVAVLVASCGTALGLPVPGRTAPPAGVAPAPTLVEPSPSATPSPSPTPTATPLPSPSPTPTPQLTPSPPPAVPTAGWLRGATAVRATPGGSGRVQIRLGANFALTVLPVTQTVDGAAWSQVIPLTVAKAKTGWVPTSAISTAKPKGTTSAGPDALDPKLAAYLAARGTRVGLTVYDMTHGVTYRYNSSHPFITASSVKVPIMLAFLRNLEAAGRRPTSAETALLTAMIEHSDNAAASELNEAIGNWPGLQRFANTFGLTGFRPHNTDGGSGWGWGTITTDAMVRLLTLFQQGGVLSSAADTRLARTLMSHVEADQRFGVGTTAPRGATVLMKNGWVPGPDGLWVVNSSGIVITRTATYVIAAYTAHLSSYAEGLGIVTHVCAAVAARLK